MISLICPHDHEPLAETSAGAYRCDRCNRAYPVERGVVRLLGRVDLFYEGAYENQVRLVPRSERFWHTWPLWLINSGYPWIVRRHVREGASVVELGCAGGVRYFGQRYRMVGCDVSFSSLANVDTYEYRLQADASHCIPLSDASVDAVVSSYFWEHIPPSSKPRMLDECARVLKPGGKLVFLYDIDTRNPLIDHFKSKDRSLYDRLFIEGDGHLGYQSSEDNEAFFDRAGFRMLWRRGMEKTWLQSPSVYPKLASFSGMAASAASAMRIVSGGALFYPYTALVRLADAVICPFLPRDWARIEMVVYESKRPSSPSTRPGPS